MEQAQVDGIGHGVLVGEGRVQMVGLLCGQSMARVRRVADRHVEVGDAVQEGCGADPGVGGAPGGFLLRPETALGGVVRVIVAPISRRPARCVRRVVAAKQ